mmetsp:Transcript_105237/g.280158  ORF Transcript_105237/g.280158 Transcript_105237/m.280158 type:complete len:106 (-) Transcript_105237:180-497(-)
MVGAPCPQYLRRATFVNSAGKAVEVVLKFKSGDEQTQSLDVGASVEVEKEHDHGSWTSVDPIDGISFKADGHQDCGVKVEASGVEVHKYTVSLEGDALQCSKEQC